MSQQSSCRHLSAIPQLPCALCDCLAPETLLDTSYDFVNQHLETISHLSDSTGRLVLKEGVRLPKQLCEGLLDRRSNTANPITSTFLGLFENRERTAVKKIRLGDANISDSDLEILLQHGLVELEMNCPGLTRKSADHLVRHGKTLVSLSIGENTEILSEDVIFELPLLKRFTIKRWNVAQPDFYRRILGHLDSLTHLDLSNCGDLANLDCTASLTNLASLVLHNVNGIEKMIRAICNLKALSQLDVSQSKEENREFENQEEILTQLVESLPKLSYLDISGTNLAGRKTTTVSGIPGLSSRMDNPLDYLGLWDCSYDACRRSNIPATLIGGDANEEQILVAAYRFYNCPVMLSRILNNLFDRLRFGSNCTYLGQALHIVLDAMSRYLTHCQVQASCSAILFYFVKDSDSQLHSLIRAKRKIVGAFLSCMQIHKYHELIMGNGCLALCQFQIPLDFLHDFDRVIEVLIHEASMPEETFPQRVAILLLNSLVSRVDERRIAKLRQVGIIQIMLAFVGNRLQREHYDDVLDMAWSLMRQLTEESPPNSRRFLEADGIDYCMACLDIFPDEDEMLRIMMALLGNVAEVQELRHYLVTPKYLTVFSSLLDSRDNIMEISFNVARIISHVASDGPEAWTFLQPSREELLNKLEQSIDQWDLNMPSKIGYKSIKPIVRLLNVYETPQCQLWAMWALAHLGTVRPKRYCALIEQEGALVSLLAVIDHPLVPLPLKQRASDLIKHVLNYRGADI